MERDRERAGRTAPRATKKAAPIALEPVDMLAGIAPGIVLEADDLPAGIAGNDEAAAPAAATVDELGRLFRMAEPTVRRLIRTPGIVPREDPGRRTEEPHAGPFVPGLPDKPSE